MLIKISHRHLKVFIVSCVCLCRVNFVGHWVKYDCMQLKVEHYIWILGTFDSVFVNVTFINPKKPFKPHSVTTHNSDCNCQKKDTCIRLIVTLPLEAQLIYARTATVETGKVHGWELAPPAKEWLNLWRSGVAPTRVSWVSGHPSIFDNGCQTPVQKWPRLVIH